MRIQLPVRSLPPNDSGRLLVRLNKRYRGGIDRYGIAHLTNCNNQKSVNVLVLGHEDDTAIFMPYCRFSQISSAACHRRFSERPQRRSSRSRRSQRTA